MSMGRALRAAVRSEKLSSFLSGIGDPFDLGQKYR
jgi:hypothetical protein